MHTNIKIKRSFYISLAEYFFKIVTRCPIYDIKGEFIQEWHNIATEWLELECTEAEKALILDFYTYNQSIHSCTNGAVVARVHALVERFAKQKGFC